MTELETTTLNNLIANYESDLVRINAKIDTLSGIGEINQTFYYDGQRHKLEEVILNLKSLKKMTMKKQRTKSFQR